MDKCAIFIDGGYLDALLKRWGNFPLDYDKFTGGICNIIPAQLLRTYYYNCLPLVRKMYDAVCSDCGANFQVPFEPETGELLYCNPCLIKRNRRPNTLLYSPQLTQADENLHKEKKSFYNKLKRNVSNFEIKYGRLQLIGIQFKQKGVDTKMSIDIVDKSSSLVQHIAIIAGDSDFIPAIQKAKDNGAIIHLFCFRKKINRELLEEVDEIHYLTLSNIQQFRR